MINKVDLDCILVCFNNNFINQIKYYFTTANLKDSLVS